MEETYNLETLRLYCNKNQIAQLLCCSAKCQKYALVCRNQHCNCMPNVHPNCQFLLTQNLVQQVLLKRKQTNQRLQKATKAIDLIYQQTINRLSFDRQQLKTWKYYYGLSKNQIKFIQSLISKKGSDLTGKFVQDIKKNVQIKNQCYLSQDWAKQFWKQQKYQFNKIFDTLKQLSQANIVPIDSKIVKQSNQLLQFLSDPVTKFRLLYRATENKFSASQFHKKCDGIPHTLTIIQTQFSKVIGGYSPIPWKTSQTPQSSSDQSGKSFIFSLTLGQKYPIIDNKYAIGYHSSCGPCFGRYGNDIGISDAANDNQKSYCDFPNRYNNGKYQKGQLSSTLFCGAIKGNHMRLKQWQVFQVVWLSKQ